MWSKLKGLWNAFWENDACMREKTSFSELVVAFTTNGGWAGVGALAKDKAIECAKDPKGNCAAYAELGKVFNFDAPPCGGAPVKGKGERPDPPAGGGGVSEEVARHNAAATAITRQLVGIPCTEHVQLPNGGFLVCATGFDGNGYTNSGSRFPVADKWVLPLIQATEAGARLGKDPAEMLAEGTKARDEFLRGVGIKDPAKYEPGSGGGGSTDQAASDDKGLSTGAKFGIAAGALALIGGVIYAVTRKAK